MEFFKKYQGPIIGVLIAAVVIVVGVVLTDSQKDIASTDEDGTNEILGESVQQSMFEPVTVDGNEYEMEGVEWRFTPQPDGFTQVRLQIVGLTRNDVPIEVLTYRLGAYEGECGEMDMPAGLVLPTASRPLAFGQCESFESSRQFVVTQEGSEVVTRTRVLTQETETPFEKIQAIDVAAIVK